MKDMLDELNDNLSLKVKELKQTYTWLAIILLVYAFISLIYFLLGLYGKKNFWIYEYYQLLSMLFYCIKLPILIVALVKVKPILARAAVVTTMVLMLIYAFQDIWEVFSRSL